MKQSLEICEKKSSGNVKKNCIILIGNICVGKTTLINSIRKCDGMFEDFNVLQKKHSQNLYLKAYYENMNTEKKGSGQDNAFLSQIGYLHEQRSILTQIREHTNFILDRDIDECNIYCQYLSENAQVNSFQASILEQQLGQLQGDFNTVLNTCNVCHIILYTRNVDILMQRIMDRKRGSESRLSREYIEEINRKYNERYVDNKQWDHAIRIDIGNDLDSEKIRQLIGEITKRLINSNTSTI